MIGLAIQRTEGTELLFHSFQGRIVFIGRIVTGGVGNSVLAAEAGQDVYMAVGVISYNAAMVQPQDALEAECLGKARLNLFPGEVLIPVQGPQPLKTKSRTAFSPFSPTTEMAP